MATQQPRHSEPSVNAELGDLLRAMLFGCRVRSENTQLIEGRPGLQLDNLITAADRAPVVVEAEYEAVGTAEADAAARLGLSVVNEIHPIEAAIALRYPDSVRFGDNLRDALAAARLSYAVLYQDGSRFPESGWLEGGVSDLADIVSLVSVPQRAVDQASAALENGIERAVAVLNNMHRLRPDVMPEIARLLGMPDVPQTRRMACAIIANAMVFHERLSGAHGIKSLRMVSGPDVANPFGDTLDTWGDILQVNYWAIFSIAKDIMERIPSGDGAMLLRILRDTALEVTYTGASIAHDLTGRIFQRLIADRKYLATFYTLPTSAFLLARLAIGKMDNMDWSDADAIERLRVGDFACGTGALLSAAYQQIAGRHERAGGDPGALHPVMMGEILYGCDVMPSAIHITGSTLSGIAPSVQFDNSRLYTLAYGRQEDGAVAIGSLELLQSSAALTLFNTSDPAMRTGSVGEETAAQIIADIPDGGFDLVIMNPPFTSNTKHRDAEGNVQNAAFAAFGASADDQDDMAARLVRLARDSHYHGHAGLGSAFASIADKKLRPGGVLALVLPFTAVNGPAWAKFRQLIAENYTDVTVVSIASPSGDISFSSDTGIAECLIVAKRRSKNGPPTGRAQFVSLRRRPRSFLEAQEVADAIAFATELRKLEDGPYGGAFIYCGDKAEHDGEILDAPITAYEEGWGAARLLDAEIAQVAYALAAGQLWLPAHAQALALPMAPLNEIGQRGLDSQLLISPAHRGPFTKRAPSPTATYPALWNHNASRETRMVCIPDAALQVRLGFEGRAAELWATASRVHINRDFRFTSQPLTAAFTEQQSLGGVAWPNVTFPDDRMDYAFMLWCNSTLGLLQFWWHANLQQSGRGRSTIHHTETMPMLDFRVLTDNQLATAETIFNDFRDLELQPAYLADADPNRALLDRRVVCDLLGFDDVVYQAVRRLSAKWCAEPSVHGGKRRPRGAGLVV
ncbi:MAG: hypothetical protein F4X64_16765 [Chloroflexi bacterium]|nr:hypothetical protein [Chloroflexota bacterium]